MNCVFRFRRRIRFMVAMLATLFSTITFAIPPLFTHTDPTPQDRNLQRLESEIAIYEEAAQHPLPAFAPNDELLKPGTQDQDIVLLRQHLKSTHDLSPMASDSNVYDDPLRQAVELFQWRHGLTVDGVVGNATRMELNVTPSERIHQLRLNMQRWSKLAPRLGDRFLLVNVPEYQLHLMDKGQEVLTMKVIVGKPTRPTPELSSSITRIIFNPYWSVPQLIAQKDIVPKMLEDPDYLRTKKIRVFTNQEDNARELNPDQVNWQSADANGFNYFLRQEPGTENALGQVKFEFVNSHSVYLHDTPSKNLFSSDERDLSSGCIRLERPLDLVSYLIQNDNRMDEDKVRERLDKETLSSLKVKAPLKIFIVYFTTWVDKNDIVHYGKDIYWQDTENPTLAQIKQ